MDRRHSHGDNAVNDTGGGVIYSHQFLQRHTERVPQSPLHSTLLVHVVKIFQAYVIGLDPWYIFRSVARAGQLLHFVQGCRPRIASHVEMKRKKVH